MNSVCVWGGGGTVLPGPLGQPHWGRSAEKHGHLACGGGSGGRVVSKGGGDVVFVGG